MYGYVKRFCDAIAAGFMLLMLSPLLLPLIVILRLTAEGAVFYRQERIGLCKKPFQMLKYATMLKDSMRMGLGATTVRNDPRITPFGKFLRKSKLNELPQLINVLVGDMSFVGPRPLPLASFVKYSTDVQDVIYTNRPGITGIGSVIFRDEEALATHVHLLGGIPVEYYREHIYPYKGALEVWYTEHISFLTDVKIVLLTAWYILFPGSKLAFRFFGTLPAKPEALSIEGIEALKLNNLLKLQPAKHV